MSAKPPISLDDATPATLTADDLEREARRFGLARSSGRRTPAKQQELIREGKTKATDSYHLYDRARDYTGPRSKMRAFYEHLKTSYGTALPELLDERNHVHVAFADKPKPISLNDVAPASAGSAARVMKTAQFGVGGSEPAAIVPEEANSEQPESFGLTHRGASAARITGMSPQEQQARFSEARRKRGWLIPGENIKDRAALDTRLAELSKMRAELMGRSEQERGPSLSAVDEKIRRLARVKNDLLKLDTARRQKPAETIRQAIHVSEIDAPSEGGRPADRAEDLPWYLTGYAADVGAGVQSGITDLGDVVRGIEKMFGVTPSKEFEPALEAGHAMAEETATRGGEGVSHEVVRGLTAMGVQLPALSAGGTPMLALVGAAQAAAKPDARPEDVARGAAVMAAMGKVLHESGGLTMPARILTGAATGAGVAAVEGGNREQVISQALLFGGLGAVGGKVKARDGRTYEVGPERDGKVTLKPTGEEGVENYPGISTPSRKTPKEQFHADVEAAGGPQHFAYGLTEAGKRQRATLESAETGKPLELTGFRQERGPQVAGKGTFYATHPKSAAGYIPDPMREMMSVLDKAMAEENTPEKFADWLKRDRGFSEEEARAAADRFDDHPLHPDFIDQIKLPTEMPLESKLPKKPYHVGAGGPADTLTVRPLRFDNPLVVADRMDIINRPDEHFPDLTPEERAQLQGPFTGSDPYKAFDRNLAMIAKRRGYDAVVKQGHAGSGEVQDLRGHFTDWPEATGEGEPTDMRAAQATDYAREPAPPSELEKPYAASTEAVEAVTPERVRERQAEGREQPQYGAGAAPAGFKPAGSEITQLGEAVGGAVEAARAAGEKPSELDKLPRESGRFGPALTAASERVRDTVRGLWRAYKSGAVQAAPSVEQASLNLQAEHQRVSLDAAQFGRDVKKAVPDSTRRDAIFRFAAARGEASRTGRTVDAVLQDWALRSKNKRAAVGYGNALKLTDAERTIADNFMGFFEPLLQQGLDAGVIQSAIDDYVTQIVKRGPKGSRMEQMRGQMAGDAQASLLNPNFKHARERVFPNIFAGEQAGYTYDTDFASAASTYYQSMGRAIASRNYLKGLQKMKAADGRPAVTVSGYGVPINDTTLVRPDAKVARGVDVSDYKSVDHWAFKGWKWLQSAGEGDVMLQGDLLVHPEFAARAKARFEPSAVRKTALGRGLLKAQALVKGTMFSLSPFHLVTEATHAVGHTVNPFGGLPELRTDGGVHSGELMEALRGGLQVAGGHGQEMFAEGLSGKGGLIGRVPGIGKLNAQWSDWLFHDYIPRLKFKTYQHILERNLKRYGGELSREQVVSLSADQANAAYGELNYFKMARSKTMQDLSRLLLLAPDFLEARARFTGQAFKGYGREQLRALMVLGLTQYVAARISNQLNHGDAEWSPERAFQVKIGGSFWGLRSVPADILHLATDPRGFALWRANPLLVTAPLELATGTELRSPGKDIGKDWVIRKGVTPAGVAVNALKRALPLPTQGLTKEDVDLLDSLLQSVGVVEHKIHAPKSRKMASPFGGNRLFPKVR